MPKLSPMLKIDLPRYMGTWHVIANIPYFAERGNVASRDVYALDDHGNVATTYFYRTSFDAPEKTAHSLGIVQPGTHNAAWKVRVFWLFRADYLILDIAPDYSWVLVGQPDRKLGWLLARDAAMDDTLYTTLLGKFHGFGYAIDRFKRVPQSAEQMGKPGFQ
ncbi:MAG TPA: lipocalin family protein [Rudaea sp.]|nr:lipocalin family protein [Rudaea sp.]